MKCIVLDHKGAAELLATRETPFNLVTETTQDGARLQRQLDTLRERKSFNAEAQAELFEGRE